MLLANKHKIKLNTEPLVSRLVGSANNGLFFYETYTYSFDLVYKIDQWRLHI